MSEAHPNDLLPAYALGSLDEEEMTIVIHHLVDCEICQQELRAYQDIVDQVPLGISLTDPPADLKQKILGNVETQIEPVRRGRESTWRERISILFLRVSPLWGLASLVLIFALVISNLQLRGQIQKPIEPASLDVITLTGTEAQPLAEGLVVLEKNGHDGTLVVNSLKPLDEAKQYQLWLIEGEQWTNGGVFSVTPKGYGHLYLELPKPLAAYSRFAITIEPSDGSQRPTGEKVLRVDL
jgi:anti-sigma-K factor RskA